MTFNITVSAILIVDPLVRYKGFHSNHVVQSPIPNEAGAKVKMAQVLFDSPDLATAAKDAMDGFLLKKGWKMSVAYI